MNTIIQTQKSDISLLEEAVRYLSGEGLHVAVVDADDDDADVGILYCIEDSIDGEQVFSGDYAMQFKSVEAMVKVINMGAVPTIEERMDAPLTPWPDAVDADASDAAAAAVDAVDASDADDFAGSYMDGHTWDTREAFTYGKQLQVENIIGTRDVDLDATILSGFYDGMGGYLPVRNDKKLGPMFAVADMVDAWDTAMSSVKAA